MLRGEVDMLYEVGRRRARLAAAVDSSVKVFTFQRPYAYVVDPQRRSGRRSATPAFVAR